jgi:hypothetical protein
LITAFDDTLLTIKATENTTAATTAITTATTIATTTATIKAKVSLLTIPPELRNSTYGHVFSDFITCGPHDLAYVTGDIVTPPSKALALTCRQLYAECKKLYEDACVAFWASSPFSNHFNYVLWLPGQPKDDFLHTVKFATKAQLEQSAAFNFMSHRPYTWIGITRVDTGLLPKWTLRFEGGTGIPHVAARRPVDKTYWKNRDVRTMGKVELKEWVLCSMETIVCCSLAERLRGKTGY